MTEPTPALLADGSTVHIRQMQPADAGLVVALHSRFSERTRYFRYFSPYPRIPAKDLERFVNVDHHDREALVVAAGSDLIAIGRYDRLGPGSTDAEVAFVVEDAWQGKGIGSLLLEHLVAAAREHGLTRFVAEVLPQNAPMLRVFGDAGFQVRREYADGVVHLTFPITPTPRSVEVQRSREQRTEAASIARLLSPHSIAVYGVRADGTGAGAALLDHITGGGFAGPVYTIHPTGAHRSAVDLPERVDLAVVAVPVEAVAEVVEDAGRAGAHGVVVVSAGFAEAGPSGAAAQRHLVEVAHRHGLRVVGPNSLGIANPGIDLNATLVPEAPRRGRIGLFCQSWPMGIAVLAETGGRDLGLSSYVCAGNRADVSGNDLLQYWRDDPRTDVVLLYLETFGNPRKFTRIARELGREKPIVAVAAVGTSDVDSALFGHSGVIRAATVAEMFDVGQLLATQPLPAGNRVGIVGNAAALVSLAAGTCARAGLHVGPWTTVAPGEHRELAGAVAATLLADDADAVLVVIAPPLPGYDLDDDVTAVAAATIDASADKPVLTTVVGITAGVSRSVPRYGTVEEAVRALAQVERYARWRRTPAGILPELADVDTAAAHAVAASHGTAGELLAAYGVAGSRDPAAARATTKSHDREEAGVVCTIEVVDDASFGPIVGFGVGGVASDLLGDRAWRAAPLTDADALALVHAPRASSLLAGCDEAGLVDLLLRLGRLADELGEVKRLTLDVLARPGGVAITDARVVYGSVLARPDTGPRRL